MADPLKWPVVGYTQGSDTLYPVHRHPVTGAQHCPCKGFGFRAKCRHMDAFNKGEFFVELQFNVVFKDSTREVARIEGRRILTGNDLTVEEAAQKTLVTEAFLEKLTGYMVHIEQVK